MHWNQCHRLSYWEESVNVNEGANVLHELFASSILNNKKFYIMADPSLAERLPRNICWATVISHIARTSAIVVWGARKASLVSLGLLFY